MSKGKGSLQGKASLERKTIHSNRRRGGKLGNERTLPSGKNRDNAKKEKSTEIGAKTYTFELWPEELTQKGGKKRKSQKGRRIKRSSRGKRTLYGQESFLMAESSDTMSVGESR